MVDKYRFLFMVDVGYACFGVYFSTEGVCSEVPPIAKWMIGKSIDEIRKWVKSKKGKMEEVT